MSIAPQDWLDKPLGHYLQGQEQSLFDAAVADVFGFNAVQVGMLEMDLLRQSRIPFTFATSPNHGDVHCDAHQLPFASNSLDLVLLPHTLDFSHDPHQALREAERVLVPEGYLIISGFNPLSAWGLKRVLMKRNGYPWSGHFLTPLRIRDWLALLGFEIADISMACHAPPFRNAKWLERCRFMDKAAGKWWPMMGGIYFVIAQKKVAAMRVIRPNWNAAKLRPRLAVVPSRRNTARTTRKNGITDKA